VPFLTDYARGLAKYAGSEFVMKNNFDRYQNMKKTTRKSVLSFIKKPGKIFL